MSSPRFSSEQVIGWTHSIIGKEGSFTWNVLIGSDNSMTKQSFVDQLTQQGTCQGKIQF